MAYSFYRVMGYPIPRQKEFLKVNDDILSLIRQSRVFKKEVKNLDEDTIGDTKCYESYSGKLLKEFVEFVNKYGYIYRNLPFVRQIRICNSLAFGAVNERSDIDLFIVCKKNRLWLCRFFSAIIFWLFRLSRRGKKSYKKFDLGFYVTEDSLNLYPISIKPIDWYLTYWIAHLVLLYKEDCNSDSDEIFKKNSWIKAILPNHPLKQVINLGNKVFCGKGFFKIIIEKILDNKLGSFVDNLIKFVRLPFMIKKKNKLGFKGWGIVIADNILKFHGKDIRKKVNLKMKLLKN